MAAIAKPAQNLNLECALCLEDILPVHDYHDAHILSDRKVSHVFHETCISLWKARNETDEDERGDHAPCPLCRRDMGVVNPSILYAPIDRKLLSDIKDSIWARKIIPVPSIKMALAGRWFDLLSHVARLRPDGEIADLAKEAAYTQEWNVLQFLVTHRLPAIVNSPEYNRIRDCAVRSGETDLARGDVNPLPCLDPCCNPRVRPNEIVD